MAHKLAINKEITWKKGNAIADMMKHKLGVNGRVHTHTTYNLFVKKCIS